MERQKRSGSGSSDVNNDEKENTESETESPAISVESENEGSEEEAEDGEARNGAAVASSYDEKLRFYAEECARYSIEKVPIIRHCIEDTRADCNLGNYIIGSLQCQVMFEAFKKFPTTRLAAINLRNNHLEPFCCHSMASYVELSDALRELNLEGCRIGDGGVEILSRAFATSTSITHLNLSDNQITDDGGEVLISLLTTNYSCVELILSHNELGVKSARSLRRVLMENKTLKKLDIGHNYLFEQNGGCEVMAGLSMNETLDELNISWNGLYGEDFGKTLSKHFRKCSLKILNIEHNRLTTFEFQKLALGIKFSNSIQEVYVAGNFFAPGDDELLMKVFGTDTPLQLLSFGPFFHLSHDAFALLKDFRTKKPSICVIYQNMLLPNPPREVSMLDICADRAKHLAMKPKQRRLKRDMRLFMRKLQNLESRYMPKADFMKLLTAFNAKLNAELIEQYVEACLASNETLPIVDVHLMSSHYLNRHPLS